MTTHIPGQAPARPTPNEPAYQPLPTPGGGSGLPCLVVSRQVDEPGPAGTGRERMLVYPPQGDPSLDRRGTLALELGYDYYNEAMECRGAERHQLRIDCFRAAEVLYLWSASAGNVQAYTSLGVLYANDRCEGHYLHADETGFSAGQQAFECLSKAAALGSVEACCKLGDLLFCGMGCLQDKPSAYQLYLHAHDLAKDSYPALRGDAALRLAQVREQGAGCHASRSAARRWYAEAATCLQTAVSEGDWLYQRQLAYAQRALERLGNADE